MIKSLKKIFLTQVSEGFVIFFIILFIILTYIFFLQYHHENIFISTNLNYYSDLLNSFFEGRLDVRSPINNDLSFFNGKWYLYWGPAPVLFIFPFRLLLGARPGDIFYTALAGLANVVLFYFVVKEFAKYFKLKLSIYSKIFILISFGVCSPNIYTSLQGMIWYTSQAISCFYLLIFLLLYFKFLNNPKRIMFFSFAIFFYCLAWFSRIALIFYGFILLYPLWIYNVFKKTTSSDVVESKPLKMARQRRAFQRTTALAAGIYKDKFLKKLMIPLVAIIGLFVLLFASYNFLRFNSFLETGLTFHFGDSRYTQIIKEKKFISFDYLPMNFYYYFLDFYKLSLTYPFIKLDREANSIFAIYPTTILLLFSFSKNVLKNFKKRLFLYLSLVTIITELLLLLNYFATGGPQFGIRYFLDLTPLVFLLILFSIERINSFLKIIILLLGIIINIFGIVTFR